MKLLRRRFLRRLVTVPAVCVVFFLIVTLLPVWVLGAAFVSPWLPGRMRTLRLLWFIVVYLGIEVLTLAALGVLWVGAGFGRGLQSERSRRLHYRLLDFVLSAVMRSARRLFHLRMGVEAEPLAEEDPEVPRSDPRPVIVLGRHVGPGDSFLIVHELQRQYGRRPRIVLKDTLQWDPGIDILLNRLPTRFVSAGTPGATDTVGELARDLGPEDAVLIFPEGGNFSEERRTRAIERLDREGRHRQAERARGLRHLMAPRPGGTLAVIDAAPAADVVFFGHSGLEDLGGARDIWRNLPLGAEVRARMWTVGAEEVPVGADARIDWLYDWWEHLDAWIDAAREVQQ